MAPCRSNPLNRPAGGCVAPSRRVGRGGGTMLGTCLRISRRGLTLAAACALVTAAAAAAQAPTVVDPRLEVNTAADGLTTPISIAFMGPDDMLVLEKDTGRVK